MVVVEVVVVKREEKEKQKSQTRKREVRECEEDDEKKKKKKTSTATSGGLDLDVENGLSVPAAITFFSSQNSLRVASHELLSKRTQCPVLTQGEINHVIASANRKLVLLFFTSLSLFPRSSLFVFFVFSLQALIHSPRGSEEYHPGSENDPLSSERVCFLAPVGPEKGTERVGWGQRAASLRRNRSAAQASTTTKGGKNSLHRLSSFFLCSSTIFTSPRQATCRPRAWALTI